MDGSLVVDAWGGTVDSHEWDVSLAEGDELIVGERRGPGSAPDGSDPGHARGVPAAPRLDQQGQSLPVRG